MSAPYDGDVVETTHCGTSGTISFATAKTVWMRMNPGKTPTWAQVMAFRGNWDAVAYNRRNPRKPVQTATEPDETVNAPGNRTIVLGTSKRVPTFRIDPKTGQTIPTGAKARDRRGDAVTGTVGIKPRAGDVSDTIGATPPMPPTPRKTVKRGRRYAKVTVPDDPFVIAAFVAAMRKPG